MTITDRFDQQIKQNPQIRRVLKGSERQTHVSKMLTTPTKNLSNLETSNNSESWKPEYLMIDLGFFSDPKVLYLKSSVGPMGPFIVIALWAAMSRESNCTLHEKFLKVIADQHGFEIEALRAAVECALEVGLLEREGDFLYSQKLSDRIERGRAKHSAARKAGLERHKKYLENKINQIGRERVVERSLSVSSADAQPVLSTPNINNNDHNNNTHTDNNNDHDHKNDHGSDTGGGGVSSELEPTSDLERYAEKCLEPTDSSAVKRCRAYPTTGRRPLKKYPSVCISRGELVLVLEEFDKAKVQRADLKHLFSLAQSKASDMRLKGKDPHMHNWFAWLTGWMLEDYLKKRKAGMDAERAANYLEASGGAR